MVWCCIVPFLLSFVKVLMGIRRFFNYRVYAGNKYDVVYYDKINIIYAGRQSDNMENNKLAGLKPKREVPESPLEKIILGGFPVYIKMAFLMIAWAFFMYCAIDASYHGYWFMFFYAIGGVLHEPGHFFFHLFKFIYKFILINISI